MAEDWSERFEEFSGDLNLFLSMITAIGLAKARNMAGYEAPAAIALMTAAFGAGQILGPVFAGYAHELWDSFAPSLEAAMIALLFAVVLTVLAARSERA